MSSHTQQTINVDDNFRNVATPKEPLNKRQHNKTGVHSRMLLSGMTDKTVLRDLITDSLKSFYKFSSQTAGTDIRKHKTRNLMHKHLQPGQCAAHDIGNKSRRQQPYQHGVMNGIFKLFFVEK